MTAKLLFFVAVLCLARAGVLQHRQSAYTTIQNHPTQVAVAAAPIVAAAPVVQTRVEPFDPHPHYSFAYTVDDRRTGDFKTQHETRQGDVVHGQYSLTDPDGSRRTVNYSAGPHVGFNAVVHRTAGVHPVVAAPLQVGH